MKISKNVSNMAWLAAIALCVLLSIFAVFFTSCSKQPSSDAGSLIQTQEPSNPVPDSGLTIPQVSLNGEEATQSSTPAPEDTPAVPESPAVSAGARLGETADAGREYLDKFIFLGDSTTYGIGYYYNQGYTELCPPSQIWTPASGTLTLSNYSTATIVYPETGEELTIVDAVTRAKPEYMLITLGTNGISFMDEEWFTTDYTALVNNIKAASPDTKIILNSIYPINPSYQHFSQINNQNTAAANVWIEKLANDTGCKYLNSREVLEGADGALPDSYHNGDGLHLNGESFGLVMNYIRTHAYN